MKPVDSDDETSKSLSSPNSTRNLRSSGGISRSIFSVRKSKTDIKLVSKSSSEFLVSKNDNNGEYQMKTLSLRFPQNKPKGMYKKSRNFEISNSSSLSKS